MPNKVDHDPDPPTHPETPTRAEAVLAAAVLRMALVDAVGARPALRADARAFLADVDEDGTLSWWARVAGLDPHVVRTLTARVLAEGRQGRTVGCPALLRSVIGARW